MWYLKEKRLSLHLMTEKNGRACGVNNRFVGEELREQVVVHTWDNAWFSSGMLMNLV